MDLFKAFTRGQENAQEQLNENFAEIETNNLSMATKAEVESTFSKIPEKETLWTGGWTMNGDQTVTPKKKLSDCTTGWILVFQNYVDGKVTTSEFNYFHIPKVHVKKYNGKGIVCPIVNYNGNIRGAKYLYVNDDKLKGNDLNGSAANNFQVLTEIYEY